MTYLITQTFILLLIAGLLGLLLGWYLTRIAANSAQASMQTRLRKAEADARALRTELDAAVTARGHAEAERKQLADLQAQIPSDGAGDAAIAELQGQLDRCREQLETFDAASDATHDTDRLMEPLAAMTADDGAPPALDADQAEPDDLQQIKGIGPKIAGILGDLGIRRFEQIAAWTPENIAWVNDRLQFKGRIEREEWIPQARALMVVRDAGE